MAENAATDETAWQRRNVVCSSDAAWQHIGHPVLGVGQPAEWLRLPSRQVESN